MGMRALHGVALGCVVVAAVGCGGGPRQVAAEPNPIERKWFTGYHAQMVGTPEELAGVAKEVVRDMGMVVQQVQANAGTGVVVARPVGQQGEMTIEITHRGDRVADVSAKMGALDGFTDQNGQLGREVLRRMLELAGPVE